MTAVDTDAAQAPHAEVSSGTGWDVVVLVAMVVGTPLLLLSINIRRGATALGPIVMGVVVVVLAAAVAKVLRRWFGAGRAVLLTSALVAVFYNWSSLTGFTRGLGLAFVPGIVTPLILVVLAVGVIRRLTSLVGLRLVLLAMSAGSFFVAVPSILDWVTGEPDPPVPVDIVSLPDGPRPDVVVLVLDGYGRADVLDQMYHFDNEPFLTFLRSEGFVVADRATSNYSMTVASLSSALSMDYVVGTGDWPTERSEAALHDVIRGDSSFLRSLESAAYQVVYVESGWAGSRCGPVVDRCHQASRYDELAGVLLSRTPVYGLVSSRLGHAFTHNGLRVLEALPGILAESPTSPRVVFAHSTIPHGPLFLRSDCSLDPIEARSGAKVGFEGIGLEQLEERRGFYTEQVACVNDRLRDVVAAVPEDAMVLIMGDHGPDSYGQPTIQPPDWTEEAAWERLSVLGAMRIPSQCESEVYPDMSLVNMFRLLLRCLGGDIEFVEDRAFVYPHPPYPRSPDGAPVTVSPIDVPRTVVMP